MVGCDWEWYDDCWCLRKLCGRLFQVEVYGMYGRPQIDGSEARKKKKKKINKYFEFYNFCTVKH